MHDDLKDRHRPTARSGANATSGVGMRHAHRQTRDFKSSHLRTSRLLDRVADRPAGQRSLPAPGLMRRAQAMVDLLHVWADRSRQRRHLARMSDRDLKDIGLTRSTADREWQKCFWQP